jgi:hypothetical protein
MEGVACELGKDVEDPRIQEERGLPAIFDGSWRRVPEPLREQSLHDGLLSHQSVHEALADA